MNKNFINVQKLFEKNEENFSNKNNHCKCIYYKIFFHIFFNISTVRAKHEKKMIFFAQILREQKSYTRNLLIRFWRDPRTLASSSTRV